jgi:hypothetical protein
MNEIIHQINLFSIPFTQVSYSGHIEYRSPEGVLVIFEDTGEVTATINSITIRALVPGSSYQFRVSAVTGSGRGADVNVLGHTQASHGD